MRRVASVILFIIGGWMLMTESVTAWMDLGEGSGAQLAVLGVATALAAPFLLLGFWTSPGNRFADLGLTVMIVAGIGTACALVLILVLNDPGFKQIMPPDKTMPDLHLGYVSGLLNALVLAGIGWLFWWLGKKRERADEISLEQVFD
jgi:hypothetical protein